MKTIKIIIAILLLSSCTKDRYVLAREVKIEADSECRTDEGGGYTYCRNINEKRLMKGGERLMFVAQSCQMNTRIKISVGKKVLYDERSQSHGINIVIP